MSKETYEVTKIEKGKGVSEEMEVDKKV